MQQHTAGPYQVGQYKGQLGIYADNVKIATVETWIGETERAESEATARLMAASPSLLAALKDLLGDCEDIVRGEERDTCRHCARDYTDDNMQADEQGENPLYNCPSDDCPGYIARHAIAQAEGRP